MIEHPISSDVYTANLGAKSVAESSDSIWHSSNEHLMHICCLEDTAHYHGFGHQWNDQILPKK